jgi:hypothetical protein
MNKLFDACAYFNKSLDVIGSITVRIAVLAVTIAVSKPVFNGIRDSSVEVASLAVERGLPLSPRCSRWRFRRRCIL